MEKLLSSLKTSFPHISFTPGKTFCWSPDTSEVIYNESANTEQHKWSLLHETGHALLKHTAFKSDIELLKIEMAAWQKAQEIAKQLGVQIDEEHIQDCLDTYRDWLYSRSICPSCRTKCLQHSDASHYRCFNCHTTWKVTPSRFCRAYRSTSNATQSNVVVTAV